jgi:hypothetical protein
MIKLEEQVQTRGFIYNLVKRWDCPITQKGIAIYTQQSEGEDIAYETIIIQKQFEDEIGPGGVIYKAKERFPSDTMWSTHGWTFAFFGNREKAYRRAEEKFNQLKAKIEIDAQNQSST